MDYELAYTKKDGRLLKGDHELRKQVKVPKSVMGLCIPLALETNGKLYIYIYENQFLSNIISCYSNHSHF